MQAAPLRALIALVLAALTLVSGGCQQLRPQATGPLPQSIPSGRSGLQEVAAPGAVQQISARLSSRNPQVRILSPSDDTLLPQGPWRLEVQLSDWPLAEQGELGLGPHLVVQLDQQPPLRLDRRAAAEPILMPELQPGSHRLTVYAARPWGEAVKSPGAFQQIRLHRVGRNAAELPARGSAQLIATSPDDLQQREPVLIDWLLLDAPLQHLRDEDTRWRLRISVNGDSFLVDRQTPVWLKGFRRGSNAVQLELLDGRGDPLNPPFNSLVREVVIGGTEGEGAAWQRSSLNQQQLAQLSGEEPTPQASATEAESVGAAPQQNAEPPASPADEPQSSGLSGEMSSGISSNRPTPSAEGRASAPATAGQPPQPARPPEPVAEGQPAGVQAADTIGQEASSTQAQRPAPALGEADEPAAQADQDPTTSQRSARKPAGPDASVTAAGEAAEDTAEDAVQNAVAASTGTAAATAATADTETAATTRKPATKAMAARAAASTEAAARATQLDRPVELQTTAADDATSQISPDPQPNRSVPAMPERISPASSLAGSARAEVNADGSLTKPARRGPLARLREKLGG
jgi:hypothetical protein